MKIENFENISEATHMTHFLLDLIFFFTHEKNIKLLNKKIASTEEVHAKTTDDNRMLCVCIM